MRNLVILATVTIALVAPRARAAQNNVRAQEKEAKKACAAGDVRKGIEILADLYVETDDVVFVYNQGRCYEQNHQWVNAIDRFREFLRKRPTATAAEIAETQKHIDDCEALRQKEEPAPTPVVTATQPSVAVAPTTPVVDQVNQPAQPRSSRLRTIGIVVGSAGIAGGVAGLLLNLKANSLADDYNRTQSASTRSQQSSYKTASMVCYGAGAAALATGVTLFLIGRSSTDAGSRQVSFLPTLTPSELLLTAGGTF